MTTRIDARFAELKQQGRSAFVTFLVAGDPDPATALEIIKALPKAGADMIEIGMPFTDPMADGPSIQAAGLRALKAGMTLKKTLEMVRGFRKDDNTTPLVLMGYYNPIYIYGVDKFLIDAKAAHHIQRLAQGHPGLQRAQSRRLNRGTVRHRIGKRHADLDDVGAGLRQRLEDVERRFGIGIAGHQEGDECRAALFGEVGKSCVDTGGHVFLPFRISVICGMSLSPRPERLTTIR